MKKQIAILQLKEKTTLLLQQKEELYQLRNKADEVVRLIQEKAELQRRFDSVVDTLHVANAKLQKVQEALL